MRSYLYKFCLFLSGFLLIPETFIFASQKRIDGKAYYGVWLEESMDIEKFGSIKNIISKEMELLGNTKEKKRFAHINFLSTNKKVDVIYVTGLRPNSKYEKDKNYRTFFKITGIDYNPEASLETRRKILFKGKEKIRTFMNAMKDLSFKYVPWGTETKGEPSEIYVLTSENYRFINNILDKWESDEKVQMQDLDLIKRSASQIFHTEFLLLYDLAYDKDTWNYEAINELEIYSYFDMCDFCESLFNQTQKNISVGATKRYQNSDSRKGIGFLKKYEISE